METDGTHPISVPDSRSCAFDATAVTECSPHEASYDSDFRQHRWETQALSLGENAYELLACNTEQIILKLYIVKPFH